MKSSESSKWISFIYYHLFVEETFWIEIFTQLIDVRSMKWNEIFFFFWMNEPNEKRARSAQKEKRSKIIQITSCDRDQDRDQRIRIRIHFEQGMWIIIVVIVKNCCNSLSFVLFIWFIIERNSNEWRKKKDEKKNDGLLVATVICDPSYIF